MDNRKNKHSNKSDYRPVSWTEYFDEAHDITQSSKHQENACLDATSSDATDTFRVYLKNFNSPLSPKRNLGQRLDPSEVDLSESEQKKLSNIPTLVLLHGGGYSALTWAEFTRHIDPYCESRILAIDLRSHGDTHASEPNRMDIDTLVSDVVAVTHSTHRICGFSETPKIVLIGHSMGGAIAIKCAAKCTEVLPSLVGFVVIDVVEGTAKDALPLMLSVIRTRPRRFEELNQAIMWSINSGMTRCIDSARVSMPGSLINLSTGHLAIHDVPVESEYENLIKDLKRHRFPTTMDQLFKSNSLPRPRYIDRLRLDPSPPAPIGSFKEVEEASRIAVDEPSQSKPSTLEPDGEKDSDGFKRPGEVQEFGYGWRADLARTQKFWDGWFDGLSADLLNAPVQGKFLLLAGVDRLDKALTIGQMQGKFMMKVLPKCGHAVHEDRPAQVASEISSFLIHNKFAKAVN